MASGCGIGRDFEGGIWQGVVGVFSGAGYAMGVLVG